MNSSQNTPDSEKKLLRSRNDRIIGGVCGGFAEYFVIDAILVRIVWIALGFMGIGILAYIAALFIMQENPHYDPDAKVEHNNSLLVGAGLIILGLFIFFRNFDWPFFWFHPFDWDFWHFPFFSADVFVPLILIIIGVVYIVRVSQKNDDPSDQKPSMATATAHTIESGRKFERSRTNRMIGGVCGGLAEYLNIDPVIIRLAWALVTLFSVFIWGLLLYIVLLFVIPEKSELQASNATPPREPDKPANQPAKPKASRKPAKSKKPTKPRGDEENES